MSRVFACSDLHGRYDLWLQIKNFLQEDDKLFFLGDAADRGPDGIKIMGELLTDKRVVYLYGNHEDMLVDECPMIIEGRSCGSGLWHYNGGVPTIEAFQKMSEDSQFWLLRKIRALSRKAEYINKNNQRIFMCHAGTNPGMEEEKDWGYKDAFIWNRDHFYDDWFEGYDDLFIVHGHTPVTSLKYKLNILKENEPIEMFRYADGHKFDIDLGSVITNKTVLLDLDTFEPIYFYNIK